MNTRLQNRLFLIAMLSCLSFVVLTAAAMVIFPGGTAQNHSETHYLFLKNPFSDLGRTRLFDGRPNTACMVFFMTAMLAGGIGLALFFIGFAGAVRRTSISRVTSFGGAGLGILAAICFVGVACTPWDLYGRLHMQFVLCAFRSLLLATVLDLIATLAEGRTRYRLIGPFAAFIVILFFYILLLTAGQHPGKASDLVVQTTGQKIVVYSAIFMVMAQSALMRKGTTVLKIPI